MKKNENTDEKGDTNSSSGAHPSLSIPLKASTDKERQFVADHVYNMIDEAINYCLSEGYTLTFYQTPNHEPNELNPFGMLFQLHPEMMTSETLHFLVPVEIGWLGLVEVGWIDPQRFFEESERPLFEVGKRLYQTWKNWVTHNE